MIWQLIVGALILLAAVFLWRIFPNRSLLKIERADEVHFPVVSGNNLLREEYLIPQDLKGELNLLFVPFLQEQQPIINAWVPFAQEVERMHPNIAYYEFPTIYQMPAVSRVFLNEGMRAGIPDPVSRERTITLYIDLDQFMQATGIQGKQDMHVLLINKKGDILWRTINRIDESKKAELLSAIAQLEN